MAQQQRRVYYAGRVQCVGFRMTTCGVAQRYAVTGYVKNLADGRVEVVAEGEASEVDRFLADVAATMSRYIAHVESHSADASSAHRDFSVRP